MTGYAEARAGKESHPTPNLIVHFIDKDSVGRLERSMKSLERLHTRQRATAVIAVLPAGQLAKTPFVQGVTYSEDSEGLWQRVLGLKATGEPQTVIVSPQGRVVWQREGVLDDQELTSALDKHLASTGVVQISAPRLNARIGQPAPNFVFEFSPGRDMPLSKLRGRAVSVVFWKAASRASIEAVRFAHTGNKSGLVVLAVNDGDAAEKARSVAAENGFSDGLVADPQRKISAAYGVRLWPTIVSINEAGMINGIRFGFDRDSAERVSPEAKCR